MNYRHANHRPKYAKSWNWKSGGRLVNQWKSGSINYSDHASPERKHNHGVSVDPMEMETQENKQEMMFSDISDALSSFDLPSQDSWKVLNAKYNNPTFVAIDPVPATFFMEKPGLFSALINVMVKVPVEGRRGNKIMSSLSIPALVNGKLLSDYKTVEIESVSFRFGGPSTIGLGQLGVLA